MPAKNITWEISEVKNIEHLCQCDIVSAEHIEAFLKPIISNASIRTGIPKGDIIRHNVEFYDYLEQIFTETNKISTKSDEFTELCSMFKVPVIKNYTRSEKEMSIDNVRERREEDLLNYPSNAEELLSNNNNNSNNDKTNYTHKDCLAIFSKLSTEEKIKFIMEFQNAEIKLTPSEILQFKSC